MSLWLEAKADRWAKTLEKVGNPRCQRNAHRRQVLQALCDITKRETQNVASMRRRGAELLVPQTVERVLGVDPRRSLSRVFENRSSGVPAGACDEMCLHWQWMFSSSSSSWRPALAAVAPAPPCQPTGSTPELNSVQQKSWCVKAEEAEVSWRLELHQKELDSLKVLALGFLLTFYRHGDLWQLWLEVLSSCVFNKVKACSDWRLHCVP